MRQYLLAYSLLPSLIVGASAGSWVTAVPGDLGHPVHYSKQSPTSMPTSNVLKIPRGGFILATATAAVATAFLGCNGGLLIANPKLMMKPSFKQEEAELSSVVMRGTGSVTLGVAITLSMSILQKQPLEQAVAFGLIPRLLCFGWILKCYRHTRFLITNTIMGTWCVFSLLQGWRVSNKTWQMFSTVSILKGLWLVTPPETAMTKLFGASDIDNKSKLWEELWEMRY